MPLLDNLNTDLKNKFGSVSPKSLFSLFLAVLTVFLLTLTMRINQGQKPQEVVTRAKTFEESAPDEILVKFKPEMSIEEERTLKQAHGLIEAEVLPKIEVKRLKVSAGARDSVIEALEKNPKVEFAEPNFLAEATFEPNDPYYVSGTQWAPKKIAANLAWDTTIGSSSVVVSVVDTGADFNHPDLTGKLIAGYDYVNNDADPQDDQGHGTHVSGIVGAVTNNGIGVAGIGYETRMLAVKVLNSSGSGYYSWVANGIIYAADNGAKVINLSLGGSSDSSTLRSAVDYAYNKGVLLVAAAGNSASSSRFYPAAFPNVMAISSTDVNDNLSGFSNYGSYISVSAPGSSVYSTVWTSSGSTYSYKSGTSMATPHVAAIGGLLLAQDGTRINSYLRSIIESSADDLGDSGWDQYFGHGRVNAYRAVTGQWPTPTPSPFPTPTPTPIPTPTPSPSPSPTPTPTPLVISNVYASNISINSAFINWTTSAPGTSQVQYGLSRKNLTFPTLIDPMLVTTHAVLLTNLQRNTQYFYQVWSKDANGVDYSSGVKNFKTKNR